MVVVKKYMQKEDPESRPLPSWSIYDDFGNYKGSINKIIGRSGYLATHMNPFTNTASKRWCNSRISALAFAYPAAKNEKIKW